MYDVLISPTTIVFTPYILIAWQMRKETKPETFRNLFYVLCEDIKEMNFLTALQSLMDIFKSQMNKWLAALPSYLKQCLDISGCES